MSFTVLMGRRKKSAAERRSQRLRAEGRRMAHMATCLEEVRSHRGGQLSRLGSILLSALQSATPSSEVQPVLDPFEMLMDMASVSSCAEPVYMLPRLHTVDDIGSTGQSLLQEIWQRRAESERLVGLVKDIIARSSKSADDDVQMSTDALHMDDVVFFDGVPAVVIRIGYGIFEDSVRIRFRDEDPHDWKSGNWVRRCLCTRCCPGLRLEVTTEFLSDDEEPIMLMPGMVGRITDIDQDGDYVVYFQGIREKVWIYAESLVHLRPLGVP
eukprot:TRINITY_DN36841_c0_g1_i2.p1 TRINITY_DN36841_c0_g1~~TRINITY_DN36841_c0_g1_i2.p1  ORF type:complete len:299 (-),score=17.75 TRINITY_DN36841_c0_g1_i2:25-831(-)